MSEQEVIISDETRQFIQKLSESFGTEYDIIEKEYREIFLSDDCQNNEYITTQDERVELALTIVRGRFSGIPVVKASFIPLGYETPFLSKKTKKLVGGIFGIVIDSKNGKNQNNFHRISAFGEQAELYKNIFLDALYKDIYLGFASNYQLHKRTSFDEPLRVNKKVSELMALTKAKRVNIKDVKSNLSSKSTDGRVVSTDWRVIRGVVIRSTSFVDTNNRPKGVLSVIDKSVSTMLVLDENGKIISPELTIWCAVEFAEQVEQDYLIDSYGTLEMRTDGTVSMNGYRIVPLVKFGESNKNKEEEEDQEEDEE